MQIIARGISMLPTLTEGNTYQVERVRPEELRVGDIIVYYINDMVICHRIVKMIRSNSQRLFIRTKGDNCEDADAYTVLPEYILGRVCL